MTKPAARLARAPWHHECAMASMVAAIAFWMRVGLSIVAVATQWHSPLPHGGNLADSSRWWARFDDPLLLRLIEAGQQTSATLAQAATGYALRALARAINPASRRPTKQAST